MKLFYSPGASSLSPHIALNEAGIPVELVRVDLESGLLPATNENYSAINAMGKVPALQLDDGSILTETAAVLIYIADRAPASKLAPPPGTPARYRLFELLSFIATELHKGFAPMFDPTVPASYKRSLLEDPRVMQRTAALVEPGPWLLGEDFTVADCYLYAILRLGQHAGIDFSAAPGIERYLQRVAGRAAVRDAMQIEGLITN